MDGENQVCIDNVNWKCYLLVKTENTVVTRREVSVLKTSQLSNNYCSKSCLAREQDRQQDSL